MASGHNISKRDDVKTGLLEETSMHDFTCPKCGSDCIGFPRAVPNTRKMAKCHTCKHEILLEISAVNEGGARGHSE